MELPLKSHSAFLMMSRNPHTQERIFSTEVSSEAAISKLRLYKANDICFLFSPSFPFSVIEDTRLSGPEPFKNPHLGHQDTMLLIFEKGEFVSFYCGDGEPDRPCHTLIWALTYR